MDRPLKWINQRDLICGELCLLTVTFQCPDCWQRARIDPSQKPALQFLRDRHLEAQQKGS